MSLDFLIQNVRFAVDLTGAVALLMAAWLTLDTYNLRKEGETLIRAIGLGSFALAELIGGISIGNDLLSYAGAFFLIFGLILVAASFLKSHQLQAQAVLIIPSFGQWRGYISAVMAVLLFGIAFLSFRRSKAEFNKTWMPFTLGFLILGLSSVVSLFDRGSDNGVIAAASLVLQVVGFVLIAKWVWQFLQLRIRESLVLIFISAALFLSTVVTLAFSTILISQITAQTEANLLTDARVMDLSVSSLQEEALAKTEIIAKDEALKTAITKSDFSALQDISEVFMEHYGLGFVTVTDKDGSALMRAHALSKRGDSLLGERAVEEALQGQSFVTIENSPVEKFSIRAGSPIIEKGKVIGAVIGGYPLDNALVDNIKRVTGLEMFVYDQDKSIAATALARDGRTRLTGVALADAGTRQTVLQDGKSTTGRANLYGQPFRTSYMPLKNGDDKIIGMISAGKPEQDILDIANATNRLTLITVLLIMLVLAAPIYLFTKRLTAEA